MNTTPHLAGRPVNSSTYGNHKCRCDGCRQAHRVACRESLRRRAARQQCTIDGCGNGVYARHLCHLHYHRNLRGVPPDGNPIPAGFITTTALARALGVGADTISRSWRLPADAYYSNGRRLWRENILDALPTWRTVAETTGVPLFRVAVVATAIAACENV